MEKNKDIVYAISKDNPVRFGIEEFVYINGIYTNEDRPEMCFPSVEAIQEQFDIITDKWEIEHYLIGKKVSQYYRETPLEQQILDAEKMFKETANRSGNPLFIVTEPKTHNKKIVEPDNREPILSQALERFNNEPNGVNAEMLLKIVNDCENENYLAKFQARDLREYVKKRIKV